MHEPLCGMPRRQRVEVDPPECRADDLAGGDPRRPGQALDEGRLAGAEIAVEREERPGREQGHDRQGY